MQKLKELIKLSNLCNFQLFASSNEGNIRHQKLRNCCVAKKLMSRTSPVKFRVFRREFLRNHLMNLFQIFRENLNCYFLSIFRVFILLVSSDSDKHNYVNEAKSVNKDSPNLSIALYPLTCCGSSTSILFTAAEMSLKKQTNWDEFLSC